jgi:phosphoribosylformylglycinamidine synthase
MKAIFFSLIFLIYWHAESSLQKVLILYGEQIPRAASSMQRVECAIQDISGADVQVEAQLIYFVELIAPLHQEEFDKLRKMLNAAPVQNRINKESIQALVIPRLGTVSPWSSKATDILKNCGLDNVRRVEKGKIYFLSPKEEVNLEAVAPILHDKMLESILGEVEQGLHIFAQSEPMPFLLLKKEKGILEEANKKLGLALSSEEIDYLLYGYEEFSRGISDIELMTFAQVNSEHCRHKIFNAHWKIDRQTKKHSLFEMIKNSTRQNPWGVLSAYSDNAAIIEGSHAIRFFPNPATGIYEEHEEEIPIIIKVETHNHPTSISPFPGAATGVGGQIRDEGATGRGGKPKAGLAGYCVSNLCLPQGPLPWEHQVSRPSHLATPLQIMIEGPLGSAAFNNEFGRPNLLGYFRTYEQNVFGELRGYHKPIMLAGGMGNIRPMHAFKQKLMEGINIIVLGGPSMAIGIGGGAASSLILGTNSQQLDFASVQRSNPEMQRRCQEVIDRCVAMGEKNPILSIHDVGAGGLSNAIPEIVEKDGLGCSIELRSIPNEELRMSPLELWCNESQERYVLAISDSGMEVFETIAKRERCPFAKIGRSTAQPHLNLSDSYFDNKPIDLPIEWLFENTPKLELEACRQTTINEPLHLEGISLEEASKRILLLPTVAEKTFLIHIGDRSVTGLVARDQMVGPWQVPVSDAAVTSSGFSGYTGEAMALGERPPIALLNAAASARMAVGESITNIACANIQHIEAIKLSANWQVAAQHPGEGAHLYEAVEAIGLDLCPKLGIAIPVGKDSVSMQTLWKDSGFLKKVTAPLSLNVTAFAPVADIRKTVTPQLRLDQGKTQLLFIDLGRGQNRLGGSCLAQVFNQIGDITPDLDNPELLKNFFSAIQRLIEDRLLLAYHDRSDGGFFITALEMAFAGHCGLNIALDSLGKENFGALFSEELGALIQIKEEDAPKVWKILTHEKLASLTSTVGTPLPSAEILFTRKGKPVLRQEWSYYRRLWAEMTFQIQSLRDRPESAKQELEQKTDFTDPGLHALLTFKIQKPKIDGERPWVAILREQGTNGHIEMAAAFHRAGFNAVDVHMSDLLSGLVDLKNFCGLIACGGFSYGDVLGAGKGWAMTILNNDRVRCIFKEFFERSDTFALGICNGCQMFAHLKEIIPGTEHWPNFFANRSESFEARVCLVEITPSPSIFFTGMEGSRIPIVVAHGEGRAEFPSYIDHSMTCMRFVNHRGYPAESYPDNPNGSPQGVTGMTSRDGRVTILMPHPERVFRTVQHSWHPDGWDEDSPWMQIFYNAYQWVIHH